MTNPFDVVPEPRLEVKVDLKTLIIRKKSGSRWRKLKGATVLSYTENEGARTPTGGKFRSRRLTIRTANGDKWMGQFRNDGSDVVRFRPAIEKTPIHEEKGSENG